MKTSKLTLIYYFLLELNASAETIGEKILRPMVKGIFIFILVAIAMWGLLNFAVKGTELLVAPQETTLHFTDEPDISISCNSGMPTPFFSCPPEGRED